MRPGRPPGEVQAEITSVRRASKQIAGALVCVALLALLFTMVNVTLFAADEGVPWFIAWLLDPMASIALGSMILAEGVLARYEQGSGGWAHATKWFAGLATWAMNIWASVVAGSLAGVLLHSVAPGLVLGLAEAAPWVRRQFASVVSRLEIELTGIEAQLVAERSAALAEQARIHRERQEAELAARRHAEREQARHDAQVDVLRAASTTPADERLAVSVTQLSKRRTAGRRSTAQARQAWIEQRLDAGYDVTGPDVKSQFPDASNAARDVATVKARRAQRSTGERRRIEVAEVDVETRRAAVHAVRGDPR